MATASSLGTFRVKGSLMGHSYSEPPVVVLNAEAELVSQCGYILAGFPSTDRRAVEEILRCAAYISTDSYFAPLLNGKVFQVPSLSGFQEVSLSDNRLRMEEVWDHLDDAWRSGDYILNAIDNVIAFHAVPDQTYFVFHDGTGFPIVESMELDDGDLEMRNAAISRVADYVVQELGRRGYAVAQSDPHPVTGRSFPVAVLPKD